MKKILLGSTILVATAFAGTAFAKDVKLGLGGYLRAGVGVSEYIGGSTTESDESFHVIREGEVHFKGKGTLDNGLTIEARIELEGHTTGDQIDENWMSIQSSFGKIMVGGNDDAAYNLAVGNQSVVPGMAAYDSTHNLTTASEGFMTTFGDDIAVHYYTPNISGFQAGISYTPDISNDGGSDGFNDQADNGNQGISVGVSYSRDFGGFDLALSGGYINAETDAGLDFDGFHGGAEVGFGVGAGSLTFAGFYEQNEVGTTDSQGYTGSVKFSTGPWAALVGYGYQDRDGGDESTKIHGGIGYQLGAGVTAGLGIEYGENDLTDTDGIGGALLLGVSF
ncbi:MAG: porin [Neomegalonema sp.]|nr:porin [Neomegalonema sp.]